jgi:MFS family permease
MDTTPAAATGDPYAGRGYRYYALTLLMTAYVFNFIDRQILAILQEPIKAELGLSDTQLGLLTGFAFALFYVVMGLPIARWADRGVRRDIVALAVGVWSLFTALSGLVTSYLQLLLVRIGVGVGEAGCSPPAHSMISDTFPPGERATALGTYNMGVNIGILFGFLAGGWLNEFFGWRVAFFAVGIPGVLLAVVLRLTLAEPPRGRFDPPRPTAGDDPHPTTRAVLNHLWRLHTFRHMAAATALLGFAGYGLLNWLPSFFIRVHQLGTGTVGTWFALIIGLGGAIATVLTGYLADRFGKRDARWYPWVTAIAMGVTLPLNIGVFVADSSVLALICYIFPGAVCAAYVAPIIAVTHGLVENRMRALSSAIVFLVLNLIGLGLGPLAIGIISDALAPSLGSDSLRYALLATVPATTVWGVAHLLLAARHIRGEMAP